jgi:hypothetical protein
MREIVTITSGGPVSTNRNGVSVPLPSSFCHEEYGELQA